MTMNESILSKLEWCGSNAPLTRHSSAAALLSINPLIGMGELYSEYTNSGESPTLAASGNSICTTRDKGVGISKPSMYLRLSIRDMSLREVALYLGIYISRSLGEESFQPRTKGRFDYNPSQPRVRPDLILPLLDGAHTLSTPSFSVRAHSDCSVLGGPLFHRVQGTQTASWTVCRQVQ